MTIFKDNEINHYSYTLKHRKPKSVILKGIFGDFEADDIEKELQELSLSDTNILKVTKVYSKKEVPEEFYFIIQLSHDSKTKHIMRVETLAYQLAYWEFPKKKKYSSAKDAKGLVTLVPTAGCCTDV